MNYQLGSSEEPSNHAERIQSGTFAHGCVKTVQSVVAAVDEIVDAVRWAPQQTVNGAEAIAPGRVAVVFAHRSAVVKTLILKNAEMKIIPSILFPGSHSTRLVSIGHISGA